MNEKHKERISTNLNKLIEGTDEPKLQELLRIFKQKNVLNDYMIKKINDGSHPKRIFYEMVPKRGPDTFNNLLSALEEVGLRNLADLLEGYRILRESDNQCIVDGNCISTNGNGLSPERNSNSSNGQSTEHVYEIDPEHKGIVLIINIYEYKYKPKDESVRKGSDNDVKRLNEIFTGLGYKVKTKKNFTCQEFKDYIKKIFVQKKYLKQYSSALIFLMSHGRALENQSRVFELECSDSQYIRSDWIVDQFNSINCPYLSEKPKAIFFQACRGDNADLGMSIVTDTSTSQFNVKVVPKLADTLVIYSTSPGFVSQRDEEKGAYFIQEFCNVLSEKNTKLDLRSAIDDVSRRLKEMAKKNSSFNFQITHIEQFGFDKHLYL